MNESIYHIDMSQSFGTVHQELEEVWGKYSTYHIFNVPETDYVSLYENLTESLGEIRMCHSANDKKLSFSKSRDIKHNPNLNHYFASSTRQPLHTDYAYYETQESPEWLLLYCLKPSEFGGKTNLLSTKTLSQILNKYNPSLLDKIKVTVNWKYNGVDGDKLHQKQIFDGKNINWNYWQIKEEYNSDEVIKIRDEFFNFLENVIVGGGIYDFSKKWETGDCIIFNDRLNLHGRDAFLGNDRWLKDHAFFNKKK
jgi:alpha-ketoglutarate-dependent taurine dioxygenase